MQELMISYLKRDSFIHEMTGATKLICLVLCSSITMLTYDTRVLIGMLVFGIVIFKFSKVKFREVAFVFYFILAFLLLNNVAIFIFSPYEGVKIYGTRTELFKLIGPYTITIEQLFYLLNITLKYLAVIPLALIFMTATHPSEFAASLNRIGISYRIAYAVAIALRYIPDVQRDYQDISFAAQARGIDLSKKEKLTKRIKNAASILMPLIFSSLQRIETISCAMELRAFGKYKKRMWYSGRKFAKKDYLALLMVSILFILAMGVSISNQGRFYNPFRVQ